MSEKKYIRLHAEIDENGVLVLVDDEGRILGVRSQNIYTSYEDLSYAEVKITLKSECNRGFVRGKVK